MYKLLLVTDDPQLQEQLFQKVDWHTLGFHRPNLASCAQEAVQVLESKPIDAVGYRLSGEEDKQLTRYLRYGRPSLPLFKVEENADLQASVMRELGRIMNRLRADYTDEYYDAETMMTQVRDEFDHSLLCGDVEDYGRVERMLFYTRSRVQPSARLLLYDIDMPQGEIYMREHNDPGRRQHRLELALRNNFFGRYVDGVVYAVSVVTPRHIRLAALQTEGGTEDFASFSARANAHVRSSVDMVKEYLELDMNVEQVRELDGLQQLTALGKL